MCGGTCVTTLALDGGTMPNCPVGGAPIIANPAAGAAGCAGNMAQVDFRWALCSCSNLDISAPLTTDGYDSTKGPPRGGLGGNVACDNAITNWASRVSVGGDPPCRKRCFVPDDGDHGVVFGLHWPATQPNAHVGPQSDSRGRAVTSLQRQRPGA